jgi:uracil-DNA glycosylase family 4
MYGQGNINAEVVFVGDAPSKIEYKRKAFFSGTGGRILDSLLQQLGITPEQRYYTYAMSAPYKGQAPTINEINAHRPELFATLRTIKPKVIVAMGTGAVKSLLQMNASITDVRGTAYWQKELGCYVLPVLNPGFIVHNPGAFSNLASDFEKLPRVLELKPGGIKQDHPQYIVLKGLKRTIKVLKALKRHKKLSVISADIETDGFDYWTLDVLCIGFGISEKGVIIVSKLMCEHPEVQKLLDELFAREDIIWTWQNGKFDVKFLKAPKMPDIYEKTKNIQLKNPRNDFDTMLAHYCLDERQEGHGLKDWARQEFDAHDWEKDIKKYLPNKATPYSAIPEHILHMYLAYDVFYTRKGYFRFKDRMEQDEVTPAFEQVLMPASEALTEIELYGVLLDVPRLKETFAQATPQIEEARKMLERAAYAAGYSDEGYLATTGAKSVPKFFNPKSPKQLQYVAYDLCQMPLFDRKRTCSKDAVEAYKNKHPFWKALAEYKAVADLFGTYVKGMLERVDKDNRIRPDFLLFGTKTGRLSCHNPNLQNIPRKSFVKSLFISPEDSVIVNVDYKTLEVVVAAILSGDKKMQEPFLTGQDFHTNTTWNVFGDVLRELKQWCDEERESQLRRYIEQPMMLEVRDYVTQQLNDKEFGKVYDTLFDYLRFLTKFITFGIMYGRKAPSLAYGELNCSVAEAELYIKNFLKEYPDFHKWVLNQQKEALNNGFIQQPTGRKRRWPFITRDDIYKVENQSVNTPIQGTASDICLMAATRLHQIFKEENHERAHVLWLVHDAIVFEVKKEHLQSTLTTIIDEMQTQYVFDSPVPFVAEPEVGEKYGTVEGVVFDKEKNRWVPSKPKKASDYLKEVLNEYSVE